jgi:hypothetical protein
LLNCGIYVLGSTENISLLELSREIKFASMGFVREELQNGALLPITIFQYFCLPTPGSPVNTLLFVAPILGPFQCVVPDSYILPPAIELPPRI